MQVSIETKISSLKQLLLHKHGLQVMDEEHAAMIAADVFLLTGRPVNAVTICRLFGLRPARFFPSAFTLETLSDYCKTGEGRAPVEQQHTERRLLYPC